MKKENAFAPIQGYRSIDKDTLIKIDREFLYGLSEMVKPFSAKEGTRVIGLTGPTCSGKTTTAKLLIDQLSHEERLVKTVSLDDFFKDSFSRADLKEIDPKTIDFDSPDTLDMPLLAEFVETVFREGRAKKPIFNFVTGTRDRYEEIECDDDDVLLFEGIQVLYPEVYSIIQRYGGSVICVRPESEIVIGDKHFEPNFIRLCRRIVRDERFRGAPADFTLALWEGVRRNEDKNIFPYIESCDLRVNTTLAYELNILAPILRKLFEGVSKNDEHYDDAVRILSMLEGIEGIDCSVIPEGSLYKEFV